MANKVGLKKVVEKMNLKNLTPDVDLTEKKVEVPDINRPALQLTGFFEHFDSERVQIIGYVEYTFLETMDEKTKEETYETLLSYQIPCIIFCRNLPPEPMLLEKATRANVYNGEADFRVYGGDHPLAECSAGPLHFHPRSSGGRIRRRRPDYGRERNRQERGGPGTD